MQTIHIQNATIHLSHPPAMLGLAVHDDMREFAGIGEVLRTTGSVGGATLTPPPLGEVWPGQGGILVATIPAMLGMPARHLIASKDEKRLTFGPYVDVPGAKSHVDGRANTAALVAHSEDHPAAKWAASFTADGHKDFFLPSRFDLLMAHLMAPQAFEKESWHWTSTQDDRNDAFVQDFAHGDSYWDDKDNEFRVRAVRTIQL